MRYKLELSEFNNPQLHSVTEYAQKGLARIVAREFIKQGAAGIDRFATIDDVTDGITIFEACGNGPLGLTIHTDWRL